jgi:hypothetical protein
VAKPNKKVKDFSSSNEKSKSVQRYYSSGYLNLGSSIETRKGYNFGYRFEDPVPDLSPGPTYNINAYKDFQKTQKVYEN